jgi:paraquat-inducible protein A
MARDGPAGLVHVPRMIECRECGYRLSEPLSVAPGSRLSCTRCGAMLRRVTVDSLGRVLALSIGGLVLMAAANLFPLITISFQGSQQTINLVSGVVEFYSRGYLFLAALVLAKAIALPLLRLGSLAIILLELRSPAPWRHLPALCRFAARLQTWAMVEVYVLAGLVAYVKVVPFAKIEAGFGLFALALLMLVIIAVTAEFDEDAMWEAVEDRGLVQIPARPKPPLARCSVCGLVGSLSSAPRPRCARCGAALLRRRYDSIAQCSALAAAAAILYIPASTLPVMTITLLGADQQTTLFGGVKNLLSPGMWPMALLVFFASVAAPVIRLLALLFLLLSTKWRLRSHLHDRTLLYRVIGRTWRWSMIDIFMLSIVVALVKLGPLATIEPGIGATCFAAVVLLSMFAADLFDPRLMWDAAGSNDE